MASSSDGFFTDITKAAGIDFFFDRAKSGGYFMPDSMCPGCALFDYNNDGRLDVYIVNGLRTPDGRTVHPEGANRLYRQENDGKFTEVTAESGLGDTGYGMGVAAGDMDNDGDLDVYLANYGPDALYRNNGDGTFANVTREAGIDNPAWGASVGFFDYDRDGHLDIYVTNYLDYDPAITPNINTRGQDYPSPSLFAGVPDALYRNNGNGTFTDVSVSAGIAAAPARGLGVVFTDLNGDRLPDVYVANDGEANQAWINQGDGTFADKALEMGLGMSLYGMPQGSMGIALGDCDHDGDLDILVTNLALENNAFYRNLGNGLFEDDAIKSKLGAPSFDYTGWGTGFYDFDHDGRLDLVVVNGRIKRTVPFPGAALGEHWSGYAEPNQLFLGEDGCVFKNAGRDCGRLCNDLEVTRGAAFGDVDNDGDIDVLITNGNGTVKLFRNDLARNGHWIMLDIVDPALNRQAFGAEVEVRACGKLYRQDVSSTGCYLSASDARIHVGLGDCSRIERIQVRWPDGAVEFFSVPGVNRAVTLLKGGGQSE